MTHLCSCALNRQALDFVQRHGPIPRKSLVLRGDLSGSILKLPRRVYQDGSKLGRSDEIKKIYGAKAVIHYYDYQLSVQLRIDPNLVPRLAAPARTPTTHAPVAASISGHDRSAEAACWGIAQVDEAGKVVSCMDATHGGRGRPPHTGTGIDF